MRTNNRAQIGHRCVVDAAGHYIDLVQVAVTADGVEPQHYTLKEGERLVEAAVPNLRAYAGGRGLVRPLWSDGWTESATTEELKVWEAEHPAPDSAPQSVEGLARVVAELSAQVGALMAQVAGLTKLVEG